jgi:DNA invertase Pin-like site-specific DNA recombinase
MMPNTIGYARVSTEDQTLAMQQDALLGGGCVRVFAETGSGKSLKNRDQLQAALTYLNAADTLAVWRLDRLGRSVRDLIDLVDGLQHRGIEFRSLTENIDTGTSGGRLVFHSFAALAQMERELISERTKAGLAAAARRGRKGGRPPVLTAEQVEGAIELCNTGSSISAIARTLGCSRDTISRALAKNKVY